MNIHVIYHKDCMDGLASAFVAYSSFLELDMEANFYPMHYNEIEKIKDIKLKEEDKIIILDFSIPSEMVEELSKQCSHITIIDHHKTAMHLLDIKNDKVSVIFDLNKSGAILTYEYYESLHCNPLNKTLFEYVQDRDLWQWKIDYSKEVSANLSLIVEKNNIKSFADAYWEFENDFIIFTNSGTTIIKMQEKQVSEKVDKCFDIKILGHRFKAINATENISELGNAICNKYEVPALLYFYVSRDEVVLSFRSLDHLIDVSEIAKLFDGGGHKCAAGATIQSKQLQYILNSQWK